MSSRSRAPTPDDLAPIARLAALAALSVIASFVAGKAARDAILLSHFAITTLPFFVGATAILALPLVVLAGRTMARIGPARLMPALYLISAAMLVGEWLILARWPLLAAVICFFHLGSLGAVLVSGFWSLINERFDARSAKQMIGRIGLGATVGGVLGGLAAERSAVLLAPESILLVLAAMQLLCAAALQRLARPGLEPASADELSRGQTMATLRLAARSPLLRNLTLLVLLGAIAATALDYLFKAQVTAAARASGADGPLRFFAIYHTVTSLLTALAQALLSRAVVARIGVARAIGVLPAVVSAFAAAALIMPGLWSSMIARGAEMITRSSVYRAAYELIFAPLPERDKRTTKVVLDVGAERVGDLLGAQLIAAVLFATASPHSALLLVAVLAAVAALIPAVLLPGSYTAALEDRLRNHAATSQRAELAGSATGDLQRPEARLGHSILADTADLTGLSLFNLPIIEPPATAIVRPSLLAEAAARTRGTTFASPESSPRDALVLQAMELRSGNAERVRAALVELPAELAALAIPLLAWNAVSTAAQQALRANASRTTGLLADALLDPGQDFTIRRRLPELVAAGQPELARWALWRALLDQRFEVRYRAGRALSHLRGNDLPPENATQVIAMVQRELAVGKEVWRSYQLLDSDLGGDPDAREPGPDSNDGPDGGAARALRGILRQRSATGLDHVFTLLGLMLPAEPMRIAFQGLYTDDKNLRATALEYLESVVPLELRARLWPMIAKEESPPRSGRAERDLEESLRLSHPAIVAHLQQVASRSADR